MNLKKSGKVFTSKFVGTGPSSYEKRIYRAAPRRAAPRPELCYELDFWAENVAVGSVTKSKLFWRTHLFLLTHRHFTWNIVTAVSRMTMLVVYDVIQFDTNLHGVTFFNSLILLHVRSLSMQLMC